jgi:hypothetical protein
MNFTPVTEVPKTSIDTGFGVCRVCNQEGSYSPKNGRICPDCQADKQRKQRASQPEVKIGLCRVCNEEKELTKSSGKLCFECSRTRNKEYKAANSDKVADYVKRFKEANPGIHSQYQRKHRYGITQAHYEEMLTSQDGKCAICKIVMDRPHVDHCHETQKVRGLLCTTCNQGLGMYKDNIELLEKAISYLKERG